MGVVDGQLVGDRDAVVEHEVADIVQQRRGDQGIGCAVPDGERRALQPVLQLGHDLVVQPVGGGTRVQLHEIVDDAHVTITVDRAAEEVVADADPDALTTEVAPRRLELGPFVRVVALPEVAT